MANPTGQNQLSPHGYGEVQQQQALLKASPISGAPQVNKALNAPQNGSQRVRRGGGGARRGATGINPPGGTPPPPVPAPTASAQVAEIWAAVAANPEASPLVRQYAQRSQVNP